VVILVGAHHSRHRVPDPLVHLLPPAPDGGHYGALILTHLIVGLPSSSG
jgi:hypothetical protein